jgi:protein-disulfide isomerase
MLIVLYLVVQAFGCGGALVSEVNASQIENYLLENPKIILASLENYKQREEENANVNKLFNNAYDPKAGNPNAKIKIIEFFDYSCSYCYKMSLIMQKLLKENSDIQVIFKELPMMNRKAAILSRASLAAYRASPSKYLEYQEALFGLKGGGLDAITFINLAKEVGVDEKAFKKEFNDLEKNDRVIRDNVDLATDLGIRGIPVYIIGNELIPGYISYEDFNARIQKQRER